MHFAFHSIHQCKIYIAVFLCSLMIQSHSHRRKKEPNHHKINHGRSFVCLWSLATTKYRVVDWILGVRKESKHRVQEKCERMLKTRCVMKKYIKTLSRMRFALSCLRQMCASAFSGCYCRFEEAGRLYPREGGREKWCLDGRNSFHHNFLTSLTSSPERCLCSNGCETYGLQSDTKLLDIILPSATVSSREKNKLRQVHIAHRISQKLLNLGEFGWDWPEGCVLDSARAHFPYMLLFEIRGLLLILLCTYDSPQRWSFTWCLICSGFSHQLWQLVLKGFSAAWQQDHLWLQRCSHVERTELACMGVKQSCGKGNFVSQVNSLHLRYKMLQLDKSVV